MAEFRTLIPTAEQSSAYRKSTVRSMQYLWWELLGFPASDALAVTQSRNWNGLGVVFPVPLLHKHANQTVKIIGRIVLNFEAPSLPLLHDADAGAQMVA